MPLAAALVVLELLLKIVLTAMEGQTPEQRATMWDWYIQDVKWWRTKLGLET
jgi:hypothetical protein